jgi:type I restriction enzyme M protein
MDASLYKDYVLTLLFVKYVTDRFMGDRYAEIEIPEGGSFKDMIGAKGKSDIGDRMNKIISKLAEANGLTGIIDVADFDDDTKLGSGKDKVDKLTNLVSIFQNESLDFRKNCAGGDDIIGDAYEYLMKNFASESGKSKGQFYTPAEVSRVMAKVIGISAATMASRPYMI